jgi:hypothetical protein
MMNVTMMKTRWGGTMLAAAGSVETGGAGPLAAVVTARKQAAVIESKRNDSLRSQAESVLAEFLDTGMTQGFFGTIALTISIHDGTIQHITRRVEQIYKP